MCEEAMEAARQLMKLTEDGAYTHINKHPPISNARVTCEREKQSANNGNADIRYELGTLDSFPQRIGAETRIVLLAAEYDCDSA